MNRQERINLAMKKRKEIEEQINEYQKKINSLKQEYEVLGDYASRLLREEEQDRKKQKYNYEKGI